MALPSIFNAETMQNHLSRLDKLTPSTAPQWGKMNVAQMLAHLNVPYKIENGEMQSNPSFFAKLMLKLFVKNIIVGEKPYAKNSRTAPDFIIADQRDFEKEKVALIANMKDVQAKGVKHFEGKVNGTFGSLTSAQYSNMFYKHIEHHFGQFGV
jgi:hypothetical protein